MATGMQSSPCNPTKCKINCCKNDFDCALNVWECRVQNVGDICVENFECKSTCCGDNKVCQENSQCTFSEFKAISIILLIALSSLLLIIFCVYCHKRQKKRNASTRRVVRVSRLRHEIAEGQIVEQHGPPINMIAITVGRSASDLSSQAELNNSYITKSEPTLPFEDNSQIVWRRRASSKVIHLHPLGKSQPASLDDLDRATNTRASTWRFPVEEGAEVHPQSMVEMDHHNYDKNELISKVDKKEEK
jgi:hypothetical protein